MKITYTIERFVILFYDRTRTSTDVDKARCKLFAKNSNVRLIPPTSAALKQHVRQAMDQGGHVFRQAVASAPAFPSPTEWGWFNHALRACEGLNFFKN